MLDISVALDRIDCEILLDCLARLGLGGPFLVVLWDVPEVGLGVLLHIIMAVGF